MKNVSYSEKITSQGKEFFLNFEAIMPLSASKIFPEGILKNHLLDLETTLSIKCDVLIRNNDEILLHDVVKFASDAISGIHIGLSCPILKSINDQHKAEDGVNNENTLFDESLGLIYHYEDNEILDLENYSKEDLIELLQEKGELLMEAYEKLNEGSIGRKFDDLEEPYELVQEIICYGFANEFV